MNKYLSNYPSSSYYFIIIVYVGIIIPICALNNSANNNYEKVPAVIVFGDSIVDPGNNNYVKTIVKCNFPPYGRDFKGGVPTGRFSNGEVPSDIIAQEFGVKELLPAYLNPNLQLQDLLTGVSFASGGAGYDPLTSKIVSALSLSDQLDLLRDYLNTIKTGVGEEEMAKILSKSIFIVCIGTDDIANTYFSTIFRRPFYDINSYTDLMVSSASSFYKELYGIGARRIGVINLPPIGCVPSQRTLGGGILRECSESSNEAAKLFNSKLSSTIDSLNKELPNVRLVYLDIYNQLVSLIQNPAQYGFEVTTKGCCGTGNIEVSILCNRLEDNYTCTNASKYIFWDSYHPTEKAYQILTTTTLNKYRNKFF